MNLSERSCVPCRGGTPPLETEAIAPLLAQLDGWGVFEQHHLYKDFSFADFAGALAFVNEVAVVAEVENHHPDISFTWGKARIEIRTHTIDGLTENDFVLAAKIDRLTRG